MYRGSFNAPQPFQEDIEVMRNRVTQYYKAVEILDEAEDGLRQCREEIVKADTHGLEYRIDKMVQKAVALRRTLLDRIGILNERIKSDENQRQAEGAGRGA